MKLLYLHGAPAAGKLTVAKAIAAQIPARIFDNHAAIDLARTVIDFGAEGFWSLVSQLKLDVIQKAAEVKVPLVIMTSCYSHPQDLEAFAKIEAAVKAGGGELVPAYLECDEAQLAARVANQDRVEKQKVTSESGLREFLSQWNIAPVPRENCLKIRSDKGAATETAAAIIKHFNL